MKFTLSWLKEHLATDATLQEIVNSLIGIGLEVEDVIDRAEKLAPFKVAKVKKAEKHPNADRLSVCLVETAEGDVQVVCGAPNARTGMTGIFVHPGTHIPGTGIDLERGVIRGVESNGMLVSERELMISDDHEGIIDLPDHFPVGTPAAVALGLDDPMIYIKVTPNRPDALGVRGIARDLAAKGIGTLVPLETRSVQPSFKSPLDVELRFERSDAAPCPLFIGRYFKGVGNAPSPAWLKQRLTAIGLRPISALVDITNYITITYNRPLHVFDADKLDGPVHARLAEEGEQILALDGRTYTLDSTMTVIADAKGAQGIAGIIGGENTSCTPQTVNVFLEVALFDPLCTAATGRKLGINSDARYRFERGVDPAFVAPGAEIASRMILDLCGGEASDLVVAGAAPDWRRSYTLRKSRVKSLAGIDVPIPEQKRILAALGFDVAEAVAGFSCKVPSWRPDIQGEPDLVEEVCRIVGLDNIPPQPLARPHAVARPVLSSLQKKTIVARRRLAARGLSEAVTWSFLPASHAAMFAGGKRNDALILANPISSELTDMRPSLVPNLLAAASRNYARGFDSIALFEVGEVYAGDRPQDEALRAAGLRRGPNHERHWLSRQRPVDVFDAKADALAVLEACGAPVQSLQVAAEAPDWLHPGRAGTIRLGPKNPLAVFGEVHPLVLEAFELRGPAVAFEITLSSIPVSRSKSSARAAFNASDLMPVSRDFAFVVDETVAADRILKAVRGADKSMIGDATIFDVFAGGTFPPGKKSVAVAVTLQPRDRTLTDAEIETISQKIISEVARATGATLRS
jgi:phenylalanyl-tRNA synthetase beta chain